VIPEPFTAWFKLSMCPASSARRLSVAAVCCIHYQKVPRRPRDVGELEWAEQTSRGVSPCDVSRVSVSEFHTSSSLDFSCGSSPVSLCNTSATVSFGAYPFQGVWLVGRLSPHKVLTGACSRQTLRQSLRAG